jgi:hypothetical protein
MARATLEYTDIVAIPWRRVTTDGTETSGTFKSSDSGHYASYRSYAGSVTPGYMAMSRRGKLKLSTLDHSVYIQRDYSLRPYSERQELGNVANFNNIQLTATYDIGNSVVVASSPSPSHLAEAYTKARARLAEKVNAMSVNLAQAGGERKQTAELLISTANRIVEAARALRRGRLGDLVSSLDLSGRKPSKREWDRVLRTPVDKRIANHWLELQYGWKPLLQDAFGVAELLSRHLDTDRYNVGSRASATSSEKTSGGSSNTVKWVSEKTTRCRMSLTYRLESAGRAVLAQTGISNPALLAWELLPYSFVVDWFVPVGNYLQALSAFDGFDFVDGWLAQTTELRYTENRDSSVLSISPPVWTRTIIHHGSSTHRIQYNRTRLTGFPPVGDLTIKNPLGGDPVGRITTALALMRQLFK